MVHNLRRFAGTQKPLRKQYHVFYATAYDAQPTNLFSNEMLFNLGALYSWKLFFLNHINLALLCAINSIS